MSFTTFGTLQKMSSQLSSPIHYTLPLGKEQLALNDLLGKKLVLQFTGNIQCKACGRMIKKTFNQGYCFPCFRTLAACDSCIIRPETCHFFQGTCRDAEWGQAHCMQPHIVYLANTSELKVGITRKTQIPTRWIDQGAIQALPIFEVENRLQSGLLEVTIANYVKDKTHWRKMLTNSNQHIDLRAAAQSLIDIKEIKQRLKELAGRFGPQAIRPLTNTQETHLVYPIINYPQKITSLNFDKQSTIQGKLQGIKGQYLFIDSEHSNGVINIRKFTGYEVEVVYN